MVRERLYYWFSFRKKKILGLGKKKYSMPNIHPDHHM